MREHNEATTIVLGQIEVPASHRDLDMEVVRQLAASIKEIGLQQPITVKSYKSKFTLVAGRHRLEATRLLGENCIASFVMYANKETARKWEISENLHRAELKGVDREEQAAEWTQLTGEGVSGTRFQKPQGGRPEGGLSAMSRAAGINRTTARMALAIAAMPPEVKAAVTAAKLNQKARYAVACEPPEAQLAKVAELAAMPKPERTRKAKDEPKAETPAPGPEPVEPEPVGPAVMTEPAVTAAVTEEPSTDPVDDIMAIVEARALSREDVTRLELRLSDYRIKNGWIAVETSEPEPAKGRAWPSMSEAERQPYVAEMIALRAEGKATRVISAAMKAKDVNVSHETVAVILRSEKAEAEAQ